MARRVYWHPYVNDDPSIMVDITGLAGRSLLKAIGVDANIAEATRIAETGMAGRPLNDPRLGCLRYD
jgi:hypothetical protein